MEKNETSKQLLIIGNGFDLACGLKSKYTDFFETIDPKKNEQNYWYYVFECLKNYNLFPSYEWSDIELQILNQLKNLEILYQNNFIRTLKSKTNHLIGPLEYEINLMITERNLNDVTCNSLMSTYFGLYETNHSIIPETLSEAHDIIFRYLTLLEDDFNDFLSKQIYSAEAKIDNYLKNDSSEISYLNYFPKAFLLLSHLFGWYPPAPLSEKCKEINLRSTYEETTFLNGYISRIKKDNIEIVKNDVLSFNYTIPYENMDICNIHGSLQNGGIIFGIDYEKVISTFKVPPVRFTKSYRIIKNNFHPNFDLTTKYDSILFFGHGLGEADYSYFQSIFDSIDLYHSKTKLVFFWYNYTKKSNNIKSDEIIYDDLISRVFTLLERYGLTFANKAHGINLLTKLQLEERIAFEKIDMEYIFNLDNYPSYCKNKN